MTEITQSNEYFFCSVTTFVFSAVIGALPLFRRNKSLALKTFCLFFICVALWSGLLALHILYVNDQKLSTLTAKAMHYFVIWIPVFYLHSIESLFICNKKKVVLSAYAFGLFFTACNTLDLLVAESSPNIGFKYFLTLKPFYSIFLIYFLIYLLYSYFLLIKTYGRVEGHEKNQIKIIISSTLIGHIGAMTNYFSAYGLWIYPITPYFMVLVVPYIGGIVYSILAFRLFDFDLIARWGIAYAILISTMGIVIFVNSELLAYVGMDRGMSRGLAYLLMSCMAVYIFEPFRRKVSKFVDLFIFQSPDFQKILFGIEETLRKATSLEDLTSRLKDNIQSIWAINHSGFVLWNTSSAAFEAFPKDAFKTLDILKHINEVNSTDFLIRTLESERRLFKHGIITENDLISIISRSSPGEKITFEKIRRTMRWLNANTCVPLMKQQLIGFIVLGPKTSGGLFNDEDRKFLSHLATLISKKAGDFLEFGNEKIAQKLNEKLA